MIKLGFENGVKGYLNPKVVLGKPNLFPPNVATATSEKHTIEGFNQYTLYNRLTSSTEHLLPGVGDRCLKAEYLEPYEYFFINPFDVMPGKSYLFQAQTISDKIVEVNAMSESTGVSLNSGAVAVSGEYMKQNMLIKIPQDFDSRVLIFFSCQDRNPITSYFGSFKLSEV